MFRLSRRMLYNPVVHRWLKIEHLNGKKYAKMISDPENKGTAQKHVNFDILGTWDNKIDFAIEVKQSIKYGKPIPKLDKGNVGYATVIGRRDYNEDRYSIKDIEPNLLYFAIFDGHGGSFCAEYCNSKLEGHIKYRIERGETDLEAILEKSFIDVNDSFARLINLNYSGNSEDSYSGTTAVVCLIRDGIQCVIAHVGDSRALLCRSGKPIRLTIDHSADVKSERERIHKSNGTVITNSLGTGLVNGRLAMTRSIGDLDLKPYGVTPLPDTRSFALKHGKDAFLVLTSDGVNSVVNDSDIVNAINSCPDPQEAANFLADQALHNGCEDNATVLIIPFGSWGKFRAESMSFRFSLGQSRRF